MVTTLSAADMPDHAPDSHHAHRPRSTPLLTWLSVLLGAAGIGVLIWNSLHHAGTQHEPHLPHYWGVGILPFIAILGCIALLPLIPATAHWWESNRNRLLISLICAMLTLLYVTLAMGLGEILPVLEHAVVAEYIPFIVLLFSLYVISGGIRLSGDLLARPSINTGFLAVGGDPRQFHRNHRRQHAADSAAHPDQQANASTSYTRSCSSSSS